MSYIYIYIYFFFGTAGYNSKTSSKICMDNCPDGGDWELVWVELCPLPKIMKNVKTPGPQNVILFGDRVWTEQQYTYTHTHVYLLLFNPKGDQSWVFIGKTDVEAETPIIWPPDVKNWLIWKDPDAGKDWRREEKGMTEDEVVGWHHRLNGHEFG